MSDRSVPKDPVTPRIATLPFSELSWERFEQACHDIIFGLRDKRPETAHRHGAQGQAQGGIDLTVLDKTGKSWGFSNKRYKNKYQPSHVEKHNSETTYSADQHVILISGIASPEVRIEIRKYAGWELWDAEDLSQRLRLEMSSSETARQIVDHHFGPRWRREFLGLPAVGAFLPPADFFRHFLDPKRLFHHAHALVGGAGVVDELLEFANSPHERIALLPGRGGIGKTRILREVAERFDASHPKAAVRILNEGVPITLDALDDLPAVLCLVIADDAHRRTDLGLLFAWLRDHRDSKLVLASRLQGMEFLSSELARAGFDVKETHRTPALSNLTKAEVKELATQILGPDLDELVERLVIATKDCPLVTVVGGRLLKERAVPPELLDRDADFRQVALNRFCDEQLGQVSELVAVDLCRRLLDLVAALNPVPADPGPFHKRMAEFLGVPLSEMIRALGELEKVGLLVRRGRALRLTPDVLADHILSGACLTASGIPTGFADEVFDAFARDNLSQLLRNLAELDWRIRATRDEPAPLLDRVWEKLLTEFRESGHQKRVRLLEHLRESASFLPERVYELARYAVRNPALGEPEEVILGLVSYSQETVLREVPELLRRCIFSQNCLPGCLDLLWELERADDRPTNQNPNHAFRVIEDAVGYGPSKPLWVNIAALQAVRRWLFQADAFARRHSPLDVLDQLLAKSGVESWAESHQFHSQSFLVNPDSVRELRHEALSILEDCLHSTDARVVVRAVQSCGKGLRDPAPYFNMEISDDVRQGWEPEQLQILDMLERLLTHGTSPTVALEVLRELRIHAKYSRSSAVKERAGALIRSIDHTYEFRLIRMLHPKMSRWDSLDDEGEDEVGDLVTRGAKRERDLADSVVSDLLQRFPSTTDVIAEVERVLEETRTITPDCSANNVVWWLLQRCPEASKEIAWDLVNRPDSPLIDCLRIVLAVLWRESAADAIELTNAALDTGVLDLHRAVGNFCRWDLRSHPELNDEEPALIDRLLEDADLEVRNCGIASLIRLAEFQPRVAIDLALAVDVGEDSGSAAELCQIANDQCGGVPDAFTDQDWISLLEKLEQTERIDHHIAETLKTALRHVPTQVMSLLFKRVDRDELEPHRSHFVPFSPNELNLVFEECKNEEELLGLIRNQALGKGGQAVRWLAEMYETVSNFYGPAGITMLGEWLQHGTEDQFRAAIELFRNAPRELPFDHLEMISHTLDRASSFGDECLKEAEHVLFNILAMGHKHGRPGEPFPEDIDVRDRCKDVLQQLQPGGIAYRFFSVVLKSAETDIQEAMIDDE